ncbi:Neutral zinc metallopeptidase, partial [Phytophthora megakarya]
MAPSLLSSISAVVLATTVATVPTDAASNSSAAHAPFGTVTSKPGECVIGDPDTYISPKDLKWIWDNRMQDVPKYDVWIMDQLVANKGSINYCIRWDGDTKLTKEIAAKLQPMLTRQHAAWNHWLIGYNCWPYDEIKVNVVGVAVKDKSLLGFDDDTLGNIYV